MKHSAYCEKKTREAEEENARYKERWPNHCRRCLGWGHDGTSFEEGVGPDPCASCIEESVCPRCGWESDDIQADLFVCERCGFTDGVTEGLLVIDECWCIEENDDDKAGEW